jgi:fructokinase
MKIYGGIEAGGTKFVCMVGSGPDNILEETRFPTIGPGDTLDRSIEFFRKHPGISAIGVASFGPLNLDSSTPEYGTIAKTPKPGWSHAPIVATLQQGLGIPVALDTDVNGAAFGEYYWAPENRGCDPLLYMTVGTGIGVGGILNGEAMHGLVHPEVGHIRIPHDFEIDPFTGACPFHSDCFEGLASGPALQARWGMPAENLPAGHPGWDLEATYIALALTNLVCTISPRRIVVGGGVMAHAGLLDKTRRKVQELLNGYIQSSTVLDRIEEYIVPPALGNRAGVLGALALAIAAQNEI